MSFDLAFFAHSNKATSNDIKNAWRGSLVQEITWSGNVEFNEFVEALQKEISRFDSTMIIQKGSAEQGFLKISLQGPRWQDAHHDIGSLLMTHNVICYDPQSDRATVELEPI